MIDKFNKSWSTKTHFEEETTFINDSKDDNIFSALGRFLSGSLEDEIGRVSYIRYMARNKFIYKILGKILILRYPHSSKKFNNSIDTSHDAHLDSILSYTIKRSAYKPTRGVNRRTEKFYKVLSLPPRDLKKESLLIIGGKDVGELLMAWCYGFSWKNIKGIDLFSLHPKIEIMNMEEMTFAPNTFDNITLCHTYGYQADKELCIKEISRVIKHKGHFIFNSQYAKNVEDIPPGVNCNTSPEEMKGILKNNNFEVIYHDSEVNGPYINSLWNCRKIQT